MISTSVINIVIILLVLFSAGNSSQKKNVEAASSDNLILNEDNNIELKRNDAEEKVDVFINGKLFTSYMYSEKFKKPVLYPVKTSRGSVITRGFPLNPRPGERTDHPHHVGLWFNYGDVNGLDFWNNSDKVSNDKISNYGSIRHKGINNISSGEDQGELNVSMEWINSEGKILLEENTSFIFRGIDNKRSIDRITKLTAVDKEVSLKDNKEGMLGMRMARELEHPEENENAIATGMYRSSEGVEGIDVWGTRGKWMNLSGKIDNESTSVAILDHPDNVGYPTYWHARGYGLYAANPLGQKALSDGKEELNFKLSAGESVTFKHRIIIYSGEAVSYEQVNKDWEAFSR